MEQESSRPLLHTRADGFTETPNGDIALVMRVRTGCGDDICWFQYRSRFGATPIRLEWGANDHVVLLAAEIVPHLLVSQYARLPTAAEIEAFLAGDVAAKMVSAAETPVAPVQGAQTPAPVPTPQPAPETAPLATPAPETAAETTPAPAPAPEPAAQPAPAAETVPALAPAPAPVAAAEPVVKQPPKKK